VSDAYLVSVSYVYRSGHEGPPTHNTLDSAVAGSPLRLPRGRRVFPQRDQACKEVTALKKEAPHDPSVGCLRCCTRKALARSGPPSWIAGVADKEAAIPGVQARM
jgi:hypothetical protein